MTGKEEWRLIMNYATRKTFPAQVLHNWLEMYRIKHDMKQKELVELLDWKSQFYSGLARKKSVFTTTVFHVAEKLGIDPSEILILADGAQIAVVSILEQYPKEVLLWMASDEGKKAIVEAYTNKIIEETKRELREKVQGVTQGVLSAT
jgi:transcriptional regulator with XRE-family HTH domain|nr:MAG TPA: Regulatory protein-modification, helix-turn-helix, transcriptional regulato, DNA [Caudoviricetes sp.]